MIRSAFCFRENAYVRMKPECWSCSWRQPGSETLAASAAAPQHCALVACKRRVERLTPVPARRAA